MTQDLDPRLLGETGRALASIPLPPRERWTPRAREKRGAWRFAAILIAAPIILVTGVVVGQALYSYRQGPGDGAGSAPAATISPSATSAVHKPQTVRIPQGAWHLGMDAQRRRLYISGPDALTVMDTRSRRVTEVLALPRSRASDRPGGAIAVDERTGRVYVADALEDRIFVIDGPQLKVIAEVSVGRRPVAIAVDGAANRVYVANFGQQSGAAEDERPGSVSVVEASSNRVLGSVQLDGSPVGISVHARRQLLYVAQLGPGVGRGSVAVIDAGDLRRRATIAVPRPLGTAVTEPLDGVYVLGSVDPSGAAGPTELVAIDAATNEVRRLAQFPQTTALGVRAEFGGTPRFYVAEMFPDGAGRLGIYEHLGTLDRFVRVAIPGLSAEASAIVADVAGGQVFVASRSDSSVTIIGEPRRGP